MKYYLGIDPGQQGAFVLIDSSKKIVQVKKVPTLQVGKKVHFDTLGIITFFTVVKNTYPSTHVFLEQISSAPDQGVTSMFSMGYGFGLLVGILTCVGLPVTQVRPAEWKGVLLKGIPKEKLASCVIASKLFPSSEEVFRGPRGGLDHNIADALLIAEWGRRQA